VVVEAINEFFVSVSAHLPKVHPIILDDLADDYSADFVIDPEEVENRLARINIHKAAGPDDLPNWLLRDFAPYLSQQLAAIFNASIRLGHIPPVWKSAELSNTSTEAPPPPISADRPEANFFVAFCGKSRINNWPMAPPDTRTSV